MQAEAPAPGLAFPEDHPHYPRGTLLFWLLRLETRGESLGVALSGGPVLISAGMGVKFGPCAWRGVR